MNQFIKAGCFLFLLIVTIPVELLAQVKNDSVIKLPVVEITDLWFVRLTPRSSLDKMLIEQTPSTDVGEILGQQPNVSGIRRGGYAVDPVVRGFRFSQINIHLDEGIHIEGGCPNRMDPVLSHVEPEDIEKIEIIRGPYLLQYGPSPAASVRVITRESNPFEGKKMRLAAFTGYDANRNGIRQHLSFSGVNKNVYYRVAGGLKDFGNYKDGNGKEWNSAYAKKNAAADLGFRISPAKELFLSYKGSFGREVMFPALPMDEIEDNTNIFSVLYKKHDPLLPENQFQISAFHTRVYHEMDNRFRPQYSAIVPPYTGLMQAAAKVNTRITAIRMSIKRKLGSARINSGIDSEYSWKDGTRNSRMIMQMGEQQFVSEKWTNLWKEAFILNTGWYAGISSGRKNIKFSANLRFDLNHSNSADTLLIKKETTTWFESRPETKLLWSLATNAAWQLNDHLSISAGLSRGARAPDLQERYIKFLATGYDKYDYLGNPALKSEINYQADLMLDYTFSNSSIYVNLFRSDVQDYISGTLVPPAVARPVSMGAPGVKQFNNIDHAVLYGFEAGINSKTSENLYLSFSAGYTYAYFPGIEKILLENGQAAGSIIIKNDPIPEIPALEGLFKATYLLWKNRLQPVMEIKFVADQRHCSDAAYEESTPGYIIVNLATNFKPCKYISFTTGINNLSDKAYYDHLNRKQSGTTGKLFEPGRTFFINMKITL